MSAGAAFVFIALVKLDFCPSCDLIFLQEITLNVKEYIEKFAIPARYVAFEE